VEEVLNFAENYARRQKAPTLSGFLDELTLCADDRDEKDSARDKNAVTLMTLHASKGLEFQRVYLVGREEGLLPHGKSLVTGNVEEERRLTYVGITRARSALTLTYTAERARYGKRVSIHPSRFLFEIKGSPPPASWRAADASEPEPKKRKKKGRPRRARTGR
jgi:superfamily I DNA/RNA helicase